MAKQVAEAREAEALARRNAQVCAHLPIRLSPPLSSRLSPRV